MIDVSIVAVGCPSEHELVDYYERALEPDRWAQLDAHLDACPRCQAAVAELAAVIDGADDDEERTREPSVYADRYVVEDELGAGAMGVVYGAHDRELDRRVALKVLAHRPGFEAAGGTATSGGATTPEANRAIERARREARALARLNHPNVVDVFDVGPCDEGLFIAMELVDGQTLRAWLAEATRPWPEILAVFVDAAQALAAAHEAGIVHRDFKPDNVMVVDGTAKVLDFGLARADQQDDVTRGGPSMDVSEPRLTRTGIVMGTPRYLAPELHRGAAAGVRSDQYAWFLSLYEAIAGRPPFVASSMRALVLAKLEGVSTSEPPWPSVPLWLRTAIKRGTSPDPDDRYPDMRSAVRALARPTRRGTRVAWAMGLAAVATVAGWIWATPNPEGGCDDASRRLAGVWGPTERAALAKRLGEPSDIVPALDDYVSLWTAEYAEACRPDASGAVRDHDIACLLEGRAALDELVGRLGTETAVADASALPDPAACSDLRDHSGGELDPADQPLRDAVARGVVLTNGQRNADAVALLIPAIEQAQDRGASWIEARARFAAGVAYANDARYDQARPMLESAYELARAEGHDAIEADAATWIAKMLAGHLGEATEALAWIRHAEAALRRGEADPELDYHLQIANGKARTGRGEHEQAIVHFERALEAAEDASDRAVALLNIGAATESLGRHEEATAELREGVALLLVDQGPESPRTLNAQLLLVASLVEGGAIDEAATIIEAVIEVIDSGNRTYRTVQAQARQAQGAIYAMRQQWPQAVTAFEAALRASVERHGMNSDEAVVCLINLARVHIMMEACDTALDYAVRATTIAEALAVDNPRRLERAQQLAEQAQACAGPSLPR